MFAPRAGEARNDDLALVTQDLMQNRSGLSSLLRGDSRTPE